MPRARRSKAKAADFDKKKRPKLGVRQQSASATRTDFRIRKVHIGQQRFHAARPPAAGGPAVADLQESGHDAHLPQLDVADVSARMTHVSANVRRDALATLRRHLKVDGHAAAHWVASILQRLARAFDDLDRRVREGARKFVEQALETLNPRVFAPFVDLYEARVAAALCHVRRDIQLDALRLYLVLQPALTEHRSSQSNPAILSLPILGFLDSPAAFRRTGDSLAILTAVRSVLAGYAHDVLPRSSPDEPHPGYRPVEVTLPKDDSPALCIFDCYPEDDDEILRAQCRAAKVTSRDQKIKPDVPVVDESNLLHALQKWWYQNLTSDEVTPEMATPVGQLLAILGAVTDASLLALKLWLYSTDQKDFTPPTVNFLTQASSQVQLHYGAHRNREIYRSLLVSTTKLQSMYQATRSSPPATAPQL